MSLETSKKVLKISGIICIVVGIIMLIFGILATLGGGYAAVDTSAGIDEETAGLALVGGILSFVYGIILLIEGIFSVRGAKNSAKIMPAWIFAIIGLISSAYDLFTNLGSGLSAISSSIIGLAISALVFVAANNIKKSRNQAA